MGATHGLGGAGTSSAVVASDLMPVMVAPSCSARRAASTARDTTSAGSCGEGGEGGGGSEGGRIRVMWEGAALQWRDAVFCGGVYGTCMHVLWTCGQRVA